MMEHIVLDAGALISGETKQLHKFGSKLWTVPEVLAEIRDSKARSQLASLPFEVEIKTPSEKALHAVSNFAHKTGDFAALSLCDLKVMALTFDLETEMNGTVFIREAPKRLLHALPPRTKKSTLNCESVKPTPPAKPCECCVEHSNYDPDSHVEVTMSPEVSSVEALTTISTLELEVVPHDSSVEHPSEDFESDEAEGDDDDCDIQGEDNVASSDSLINRDARVHFVCDEPDETSSSDPVSFSPEDFPDLGSASVHLEQADLVKTTTTASSWAKITASVPHASQQLLSSDKRIHHNEVIGKDQTEDLNVRNPQASITRGAKPNVDALTSRILSLGTGGQIYTSAAWAAKQAMEDDGIGWVNPSNLSECRATGEGMLHAQSRVSSVGGDKTASGAGNSHFSGGEGVVDAPFQTAQRRRRNNKAKSPEEQSPVVRPHAIACITTDYAMQNVMIQMGLQLVSIEGRIVDQVKQWILRCGACFQIHYDMDRLFCSRCGSNMMQRISASLDSRTGELRLHLKKNYIPNTRGQKYSLPAPGKQGRFSGELLLREDQLLTGIWRQKTVKIRKDVRSAFGEDITSDVGLHINKGSAIKVGLGKRNPNAQKGRERRGKKK